MWSQPPCSSLSITSKFPITGPRDGGVPSKIIQPLTIPLSPAHIKICVNNQPTEAIMDTGSAISIIRLDFLKAINHTKFTHQTRTCQCANLTPLNIIGQIQLAIKIKHITTYVDTYVATNLITPLLLDNDWIDSHHVHLFADQKRLTIPDHHGQLIAIPYIESTSTNYPALLLKDTTLLPYSQTLVDITSQVNSASNLIFEPYERYISKFIFIPHTLFHMKDNKAQVLLINARGRQQTLSKNTRIGTISRNAALHIFTTTQSPVRNSTKRATFSKDNTNPTTLNTYCYQCHEYFLSGNDLQKHLRAKCYSEQIRNRILELTEHLQDPKHQSAIQDIPWRHKILFDPTPSIINIPPQSATETGNHPPIYSKQYPASHQAQEIKFQETQKLLERGQIESSTSPWSSPIVLVTKNGKTMRFCIDYRRLNAITIKDAFPLP